MLLFNSLKKNIKKDFSDLKKIRLAILADAASQLLHTAIRGYGYEQKVDFEIYEAEYNQIDLQVFDSSSELYEFAPQFLFINMSSEHVLNTFFKLGRAQQLRFADDLLHTIKEYHSNINSRLKANIIFNTLPEINDAVFGNYASKVQSSFIYQLRKFNIALMELSQKIDDIFIADFALLQAQMGRSFAFDSKMYINSDMVYSLDYLPYVAKNVTDTILSITGGFKKCLVLDLDNTTWGGIIGDDGIEGIQLGHLGIGKVFTELQLWAKQLKNRGIIVAICSKNTEDIAREPFENHPDMVLRIEDIAVFVANWETKADNIKHIQSILNIGMDAIVFIDDNPFEREMVRSAHPEVTVPELPEDPADYLPYLRSLNLFETASYTEEDETRTKQYQEEAQRNTLMKTFEKESDFLKSLEMSAEAISFTPFNIPRVSQLTQRSNQFNLRTVRYTDHDIKNIVADPDHYTISLSLKDKFGDHGLIGVIILKKLDTETIFIDTWIMSCRVLKRGMESFTMNAIADIARKNGYKKVVAEYIPTKKNGIVKDHYRQLGFTETDGKWVLNTNTYTDLETFIDKTTSNELRSNY